MEKFAELAVSVGANMQKGQQVVIRCDVKVKDFAHLIAAKAYELGAKQVIVQWGDEELSRLASHIAQMRACLEEKGAVGRRLDFLTQEMNREVNTIGSKASDLEITQAVVAAKSEIEKLREQVQNVE